MANNTKRVYWDTCVFIDLLQQTPGRYEACRHLHEQAEHNTLLIVTSAVTIAELVRLDGSSETLDEQSRKILEYLQNYYIVLRQLDRTTAEMAHHISRQHGLIHLDAIHVASAIEGKASVLYTFDGPKKRRKGLLQHNLKIGTPPLRIEEPPAPPPAQGGQGNLFH